MGRVATVMGAFVPRRPTPSRSLRRPTAPLLGLVAIAAASCDALPWMEHTVRLPDGATTATFMIRAGGGYRTVVRNDLGQAAFSSLPNGTSKRRASLYLTPEDWLVVIDAGGGDAFFDITRGRPPRVLRPSRQTDTDAWSSRWRYLGRVERTRGNNLAFYPAHQKPECIELLGAGESPYRHPHQAEHFCD